MALLGALPKANDINETNYLEVQVACQQAREAYDKLNIDDRPLVINYSNLTEAEAKVKEVISSLKPVATQVITFSADELGLATDSQITSSVSVGSFKVVGTSAKEITIKSGSSFKYNGETYSPSLSFSMGGAASFGSSRYIEFTTTKEATVTVVAKSSGSDARTVKMVANNNLSEVLATFEAGVATSVTSKENVAAGTYQIGSAGSGIYIYEIIIEYFD